MMSKYVFCFLIFVSSFYLNAQEKVKFMLFTDLHVDLINDGADRLHAIINQAESNHVDFIIELGDFAPVSDKSATIKQMLEKTRLKTWHVIGNHDADRVDKQIYTSYWGMPASFYYFDWGKFRFIVLDSNFFKDTDGVVKPYDKGNYGRVSEPDRNFFSREELLWLEDILQDTSHICILFSHAPINDQYSVISQNKDLHGIITKARDKGTRVAAAFGGHIHSDNYHCIDGINYVQVNSASYIWGGQKFVNTQRYSDSINQKYPSLKYTIPYETALYAIVEIDSSGKLTIHGVQSNYVKPEPDENLLKEKPYPCSPVILDRKLTF